MSRGWLFSTMLLVNIAAIAFALSQRPYSEKALAHLDGYRFYDDHSEFVRAAKWPNTRQYDKGANHALGAMVLLSLQLDMSGQKKTWREMCETVRERLKVRNPE